MEFLMNLVPPTATAQMKKVRVVHGRPVFFEPPKVKAAKAVLISELNEYRPSEPMQGALSLETIWYFPKGKSHKDGEYRVTRPDTDNLQKMLKDCMTEQGFWQDDAQVVKETVTKMWSESPCGIYIKITRLDIMSAKKEDNHDR